MYGGMAVKMIRKQLYIEPAQDRKLKAIAIRRGCTEAHVIREAIQRLPAEEDPLLAALRARGLVLDRDEHVISDEELAELDREWAEAAREVQGVSLSEAVLQEREESYY